MTRDKCCDSDHGPQVWRDEQPFAATWLRW